MDTLTLNLAKAIPAMNAPTIQAARMRAREALFSLPLNMMPSKVSMCFMKRYPNMSSMLAIGTVDRCQG